MVLAFGAQTLVKDFVCPGPADDAMGTAGVTVRVEVKTTADRLRAARELRTRMGARLYREGIATRQDWRVAPSVAIEEASSSTSDALLPPDGLAPLPEV